VGAYQTRQKKALMRLFRQHPSQAHTIEEIVAMLAQANPESPPMGRSTVYRLVAEFASAGILHRFSQEGARGSRYQYVGDPACAEHLHLKCTQCGTLFHLSRALTEDIFQAIHSRVRLNLNTEETILLGTCEGCEHA
jgi:Fur family ferric uptake transcriptional regulator